MTLKILLLNFPKEEVLKIPEGARLIQSRIEDKPTFHDYHVIIIDTDEVFKKKWWLGYEEQEGCFLTKLTSAYLKHLHGKIREQIETGGITLFFSGSSSHFGIKTGYFKTEFASFFDEIIYLESYFLCPIDLGVISETGDTFYPKTEELRYYSPLILDIPLNDIYWSCYFSKIPKNARVLGVNRAGYSVFMEVPLGAGKLIMLPRFRDRVKAVTTIINKVIPQIMREEEISFVPQWLQEYISPYEIKLRSLLKEIEQAKRLLFAKDKVLKKAVAFAFEKLGFKVEILPDGTIPDLRITCEEGTAVVEVKGHETTQSDRKDVLQILGYLSEQETPTKGILVSNHELKKNPKDRRNEAFTEAAIHLAEINNISLISCVDLYNVIMEMLEDKLSEETLKKIRSKILLEAGVIKLT